MFEKTAIEDYWGRIDKQLKEAYKAASEARKQGFDPEDNVDMPLVNNMAERVEGIISIVAPQITGSGVPKRIGELEKKYGAMDWRVAFTIALEVARQKFCKFKDQHEAMEIGIRTGFAYITMGVVASPLEGFIGLKTRKTRDNKEYLVASYAGPVRSAGGTGASVGVLIADYMRKQFGYASYDPTEEEVERTVVEIYDYHERVANLQYLPSEDEIRFLVRKIPIQIDGEPTEEIEVSRYHNLGRIETNDVRNGVCLVLGEGIAQKAPKLWKQLSKWGEEFGIEWGFLEEFIELQKKIKAKQKREGSGALIKPDYTFIKDLAAGRPVLTHPMRAGGFRLRYGRTRTSGYSSNAIHPAVMHLLDKYLATGTQLKVERPGKGCTVTHCDSLEGPIIKLKNGNVLRAETVQDAKQHHGETEKILFLGDMLVNYGDFFNRAHTLVAPGYCEEWWAQEVEKATVDTFGNLDTERLAELVEINPEALSALLKDPIKTTVNADDAIKISRRLKVPLHPRHTYHWNLMETGTLAKMVEAFEKGKRISEGGELKKVVLSYNEELKKALESIGAEHVLATNEFIVLDRETATVLLTVLGLEEKSADEAKRAIEESKEKKCLEAINLISPIRLRDKSGIFIGARMGRPEKAKQRKLTGSPQVLFPVGDEGGRLRCFQAALGAKTVRAEAPVYKCAKCNEETVYGVCDSCGKRTKQMRYCKICGVIEKECSHESSSYKTQDIPITRYFERALKKLGMTSYPDLIKGVRGTSNRDHVPENLIKGIVRAKHEIYVNKDGTTRYDMTQLPITHFKPKEIGTGIERLKELGYEKDAHGKALTSEEQVVEIKPQDIILPMNEGALDEGADKVLFRAACFIDELLEKLYGLKPFYSLKNPAGLVGHLVICLAPHTSAAITARIVGFSKTQGFFAHPMLHAATRRDCLDYNTITPIFYDGEWHLERIGEFIEKLKPDKKFDSHGTLGKKANGICSLSLNLNSGNVEVVPVEEFTKHTPSPMVEIELESGRTLRVTEDHQIFTPTAKGLAKKRAVELKTGDELVMPYTFELPEKEFVKKFREEIGFPLLKKQNIRLDNQFAYPKIKSIKGIGAKQSYCMNLKHHNLLANGLVVKNCDGDEASVTLLMDALLNFSRKYLPAHRGAKQDAPLVLTSNLIASEVDDMVFDMDIAWRYPLEFYNACLEYKKPWEVQVEQVKNRLGTGKEYEGIGYTHEVDDVNAGVKVSAYKTIPTMKEKVDGQMKLAKMIRAVDSKDVAKLVIEKHFIRDTKGNLRKFSMQQFRCVNCNEKYRRPPLIGKCLKCGGRIIFTISEGSITKYLGMSIKLAKDYDASPYLRQSLDLLKKRVEGMFGKEEEKQEGLKAFMQIRLRT